MRLRAVLASLLLPLGACDSRAPESPPAAGNGGSGKTREPARIVVDHILIGVRSPAFPKGKRSREEARALAHSLLERLQAGGDWAAAKKEHSEDPPPGGPYALANRGVPPEGADETQRERMVPAFGDVGFTLRVGEIAVADYDAVKSPFGYHLIRRVK